MGRYCESSIKKFSTGEQGLNNLIIDKYADTDHMLSVCHATLKRQCKG